MKRVLLVIAAALVVSVGVLIAAPNFIDWDKHKQEILVKLEEATGYEYKVGGKLDIVLLPYPRFTVEQLAIVVPREQKPFIALERADIALALWPLLQGKAEVSSVSLVKPEISVAVAADGSPSWMTPVLKQKMENKGTAQAGGANFADAVALNEIKIKDGVVHYADRRSGKSYELQAINMALRGDTLLGPYSASGSLGYNGQQADIAVNTGRIDDQNRNIALQATIKAPASSSVITYSGVLALQGQPEIQGETGISTSSVAGLMALAGGKNKPPAALEKPMTAKGVLTASAAGIAYKNMQVSFAGIEAGGAVTVTMPKGEKPMDAVVDLAASKPIDLAALMPAAGSVGKPAKSFLPDSVTLPSDLNAKVTVKVPALSYKGLSLDNAKLDVEKAGKDTNIKLNGDMPGDGHFDLQSSLAFASSSKTQATGAVTLSDPSLSYRMSLKSNDALKIVQLLSPAQAAKIGPSFQSGIGLTAEGVLKPKSVTVKSGALSLLQTDMAFGAALTTGRSSGRDLIKLSLSADQMDMDRWMTAISGQKKPAATTEPPKPLAVQDMVKTLALPFDLDLSAKIGSAQFKGKDYKAVEVLAGLAGAALDVKTASLTDEAGNSVLVKARAGDITALKDMDVVIQAKTPDTAAMLKAFGKGDIKLPPGFKDAELLAEFKGQADKLAFTANLKAMRGSMDASGALTDMLKAPKIGGLTVRVKHPNYVEVARLYNPNFNSGVAIRKDLDIFTSMERSGDLYKLTALQATVGPSTITGTASADLTAGKKPAVSADLKIGDLPLDQLMGHDAGHKGTARVQPSNKGDVRWSRNAINTEWMHKFNLALKATAGSLSYGPWDLKNATVDVNLTDGVLTIARIDGTMHGGQASLSGKAASSAKPREPLSVEGKIGLKNVSLESFVSSFSGARLINAKGTFSMDTDVAAAGLSPAALIFDLHGKGGATGNGFVFEGFDLARLSRTLAQPSSSMTENLTSLLNTTMSGGTTAFETLTSAYTIQEGVIRFSDLTLKGPSATVSSLGNVNLPLWTIDMESSIKLAEPADAPPLKAVFKGPLDRPAQTFAKSALDGYVQNLIGNKVQELIQDKLKKEGILDKILPPQQQPQAQPQPSAPQPQEPVSGTEPASPQGQVQPAQPQQPVQQQPKPMTPEDAFMGILQGVIQGQ